MQELSPQLHKQMKAWLYSGCFLIFAMVIIGGITRLTGSGLSITEWKVITGTIPPLNEADWVREFEKYKQIPQYQEINSHFNLSDFKFIYFWEYFHRLFGRLIGIVFLAGYIYFEIRKAVSKSLRPKLLIMFLLGGLQGLIGWYMVSSGLTENVYVSHLRLALHLIFAFITFGYVYYVTLTIDKQKQIPVRSGFKGPVNLLLFLVVVQIIYGGFVAGLKAGMIYNTWPKMGEEWMAASVPFSFSKDGISSLWNNPASVQFIHRMTAYCILLLTIFIWIKSKAKSLVPDIYRSLSNDITGMIVFQVILGIITLILQLPLWIAIAHQVMAFIIFARIIKFRYLLS